LAEYPVNMQLIQEMNALVNVNLPLVNFKTKSKPTAKFIDMSKYTEKLQQDLHTNLQLGIDAKQVFAKLDMDKKQEIDNTIFVPEENELSWLEILIFALFGLWNVLLTLALAAFWYMARHSNDNNNLDLPNLSALATALPLALAFDINPPTPTPTTPCDIITLEDELDLIGYVLLVSVIIISLYIIYNLISKYRTYRRMQTYQLLNQTAGLYYKIFSPTHICILYLTDIPVDARITVADLPKFAGYSIS
jgi:hypothetical protein